MTLQKNKYLRGVSFKLRYESVYPIHYNLKDTVETELRFEIIDFPFHGRTDLKVIRDQWDFDLVDLNNERVLR